MELRQFRQFVAVAEELSFRRAAKRLNMAQPPLTAAIKKLEDEIGVVLIERTNKISRLTEAGQLFLEEARRTVIQADRAIALTRDVGRGMSGVLRLTYLASAMSSVMPPILREFRDRFPDVITDLQESWTDQQIAALTGDRSDIGFIALPVQDAAGLTIDIALDDEFVVALPPDHPASCIESLTDCLKTRFRRVA